MSLVLKRWAALPARPAVYAMYGGWPPRLWIAYVGMAGNLNRRLGQHFINRDSSVTTGTAAAIINPEAVRLVRWWEHPTFTDVERLHAAELVAFDVFEPALRSRGAPRRAALAYAAEPAFRSEMEGLFREHPAGEFRLPWLWDVDARVEQLEERLAAIEARVKESR